MSDNGSIALSAKESALLLFKTIKAICDADNNIANVNKYDNFIKIEDLRLMDETQQYIKISNPQDSTSVFTIEKPILTTCPVPPSIFQHHIIGNYEDANEDRISLDDEGRRKFANNVSVVNEFWEWMAKRAEWQKKYKKLLRINMFYAYFYTILVDFKMNPDEKELIFAFGMFYDTKSKEIRHPLFVKRLKVEFTSKQGDVLRIVDDDSELKYETDFLSVVNDPSLAPVKAITDFISEYQEVDPYETSDCVPFLTAIANRLSAETVFCEDNTENKSYRYNIKYEPCIIYRKRGSGLSSYLEKVKAAIENNVRVPMHISKILSPGIDTGTKRAEYERPETIEAYLAETSGEHPDILFAKPANKEQLQIALEINTDDAIEVQGPPGTGKTHTIANLIGHFLSDGKTVLVSSEKKKALTVLKDKLDDNLQSLCVPVFEDNQKELEGVIQEILGNYGSLSTRSLQKEVEELVSKRKDIMSRLNTLRNDIFALRKKSLRSIVLNGDGTSYSVIEAAKFVSDHGSLLSLIPDYTDSIDVLPLAVDDLEFLYRSNEDITASEETELSCDLVDYHQLMRPEEFSKLVTENENCLDLMDTAYTEDFENNILYLDKRPLFNSPSLDNLNDLADFVNNIRDYKNWELQVIDDGSSGAGLRSRWNVLTQVIEKYVESYNNYFQKTFGYEVNLGDVEKEEIETALPKIQNRFEDGGGFGFLYMLFNKDVEHVMKEVRVNDKPMESVKDCECISAVIDYQDSERQLRTCWEQIFANTDMCPFEQIGKNISNYVSNVAYRVKELLAWGDTEGITLLKLMKDVGFNRDFLSSLSVKKVLPSNVIDDIRKYMNAYIENAKLFALRKQSYDTFNKLRSMLENAGNSNLAYKLAEAIDTEDVDAYDEAYADYKAVYDKYDIYRRRHQLLAELDKYAPKWADSIQRRTAVACEHFSDFHIAWKTMRLKYILNELFADSLSEKERCVEELSKVLRELTGKLVGKKAWLSMLQRIQPNDVRLSSLKSWLVSNRKVGKGTGKYANVYRSQARECLKDGQSIVPVWITPINRALELFDPNNVTFDIAIIDEASQSSLEALAVSFLADKVIVVGDDKQVSPMLVGTSMDERHVILQQNLQGIVKDYASFDGRTSYYDLVGRVYASRMLKEHFRCVPEIINYSNIEFYNGLIKPLRDSNACLLKPPVVPFRVEGKRTGDKIKTNKKEALTIITLIKSCLATPEYKGKSFGVISLKGKEQADYINSLLPNYVTRADIEERELICGDSASFQGDERDVIFITMIDDDDYVRNVTADDMAKRYNVAVSRAKDQVWIVHSFDYKNGKLKPDSLQYRLLDYAYNYQDYADKLKQAELLADSPFEAEVAKFLINSGYNIKQQYQVGSYFIDIVVVGEHGQIAIECDGERYHSGEEKIREDMERQCILQRLGWRFIRIRGGMFYKDKETTMSLVYKQLEDYEIEPGITYRTDEAESSELLEAIKIRAKKYYNDIIISNKFKNFN